ncbi:MAG: S-layer glycoprotein N-glycosyltransferase AglJ [Haloplanus sp.]
MTDSADVCVLIPTLDEAETIGDIVGEFRDAGYDDVLVVDGGSTDGTREEAREAGARVVRQSGSGKGQAVREAVEKHVDAEHVLMLDGDGTYHVEDAEALLEPLRSGAADHVIGNRFADMQPGAMTLLNRVGNRLINGAFDFIHRESFDDILSGYRAFTRESFERMHLTAEGFGIETEMAVECAKHDIPTAVVPVTYSPRPAGSNTNLHPIRDGGIIILELFRRAKTNNPLFYFGSLGSVATLGGALVAAYVGVEWVTRGVSHEVLAVVSAFSVLVGVQLLMFGMLADLILSLHREQLREQDQDWE